MSTSNVNSWFSSLNIWYFVSSASRYTREPTFEPVTNLSVSALPVDVMPYVPA